ncbi:MAG: two-component regulator propeller domain-containing protein, partial [Cyclobacteriaceae bacterium]
MDKCVRVIFFLLAATLSVSGNPVDSLRFFRVKADLSQNSITRIVQDNEGYLWFATRYGLNRFDGESILSYYGKESRNGVLGNSFTKDLIIDSAGRLHIATFGGGVNVHDEGVFENLDASPELTNLLVNNIAIDLKGDLWAGTDKSGVIKVPFLPDGKADHSKIEHYRHYAGDPFTLSGNSTSGLAVDGQGNIWVGTWDQGLNVYIQQSGRFVRFDADETAALPGNIIRCINSAPDGSVWVGFQKGIRQVRYTRGGYQIHELEVNRLALSRMLEDFTVLSILEDDDHRLWIGTENEGLIVVDLESGEYGQYKKNPDNPFSVGSNSIWSLYQDRAGTIWIGTFDQGVYKVDPHEVRFDHVAQVPYSRNTLSHSLVSSFAPDDTGGLWIGTDGGGLNYRAADGTFEVYNPDNSRLRSSSVLSLLRSHDGKLWAGGWRNGLIVIDSKRIKNFPSEGGQFGTGGSFIFDLHEGPDGNIWIASFRTGIDLYLPAEDRFLHFEPNNEDRYITANTVQAVTVDAHGVIWIGTEGSGIDRMEVDDEYKTRSLKNYSISKQGAASHSSITSLFTDSKNRLWVGTRGDGLARYNNKKDGFETITTTDGLPSNLIYSIEEDQQGRLWLSTNKGIISYHPESGRVETFDVADGLQGLEFFPRSSYTMPDGTMVFGGINGFNRFHPSRIASIPSQGAVY